MELIDLALIAVLAGALAFIATWLGAPKEWAAATWALIVASFGAYLRCLAPDDDPEPEDDDPEPNDDLDEYEDTDEPDMADSPDSLDDFIGDMHDRGERTR